MNHLKKFNESNSYQHFPNIIDIINDLKDICLELSDQGFNIWVGSGYGLANPNFGKLIILDISAPVQYYDSKQSRIFFNKSKEVVERLKDYMNQNGYKSKVEYRHIKLGRTASIHFDFIKK